jgi:ABC-type amino acid transport system permease subunit
MMGNITIQILLTTPLVSVIGAPDLMFQAMGVEEETHDVSVFVLALFLYMGMAAILAGGNALLERRLRLPGDRTSRPATRRLWLWGLGGVGGYATRK